MFTPPPLPPWEGLHPLVVHFPIALLIIAPLLVILAACWCQGAKPLMTAAWLIITLGTAGIMLATATGDDAKNAAIGGMTGWYGAAQHHEKVAEIARNIFICLWVLFTLLTVIVLAFGKPIPRKFMLFTCGFYLILHLPALLVLANAAHLGGKLVHEYGARAPQSKGAIPVMPPDEDENDQ